MLKYLTIGVLALAGCTTDLPNGPDAPPQHDLPPLRFGVANLQEGPAQWIWCDDVRLDDTNNYYVDGPHFSPGFPTATFTDPDTTIGVPENQCGDLIFNDRTKVMTVRYASAFDYESPWKYWWRRARRADNGTPLHAAEVVKESAPRDSIVTTQVPMWLSEQYDGIGALLILEDDGSINWQVWIDTAFTNPNVGPWGSGTMNLNVQHWANIEAPTLVSATLDSSVVTLSWSNGPIFVRSIDSTTIYREGSPRRTVGAAVTSFPDTVPGPGEYHYTVKHHSPRLAPLLSPFPNSASSNTITVTVGTACARLVEAQGSDSTWKVADQYLSAGCSLEQGTHMRYRWLGTGDVVLQDWTADTLFDFLGHTGTGTQRVILEDRDTVSEETSRDTLAFTVFSNQVVLSGPTYIVDKGTKTYSATAGGAPHAGQWFERYDDGPGWYPATAYEQTSMNRIWPAGDYAVTLRQQKKVGAVLHRGRREIVVCSVRGCEANAPAAAPAAAGEAGTAWGLFGAGPWLSWSAGDERLALRWYDLGGQHDGATPFTDVSWFTGAGGEVADPQTGWSVTWAPRELGRTDARRFDVTVEGTAAGSYVFGMAVDPDLGLDAADDVARYDATRHLVLVADGDQALGLLLRRAGRNALAGVQEYGVRRWAPRTSAEAWAAQHVVGVELVGTPRDVQLLLSADATAGPATWEVVVVRGATVGDVQAVADAVLGRPR